MAIPTIARLTLRELARRRVVMVGLLLSLVMLGLTAWGFSYFPNVPCRRPPCSPTEVRAAAAPLLILVMYAFSFVIALCAAFLAAPSIASDIESGIALAVLPRPIRRSEVLLGKWLALAGAIVIYTIALCGIEYAITRFFVDYLPPYPWTAVAYIAAEGVVLLTLALLGSTRLGPLACGIVAVVLFGAAWMAGVAGGFGAAFQNQTVTNVGVVSSLLLPTDGLWRGAMYHLEPAAFLALVSQAPPGLAANPFFVTAPPTTPYLIWTALWIVVMLALAAYSFERREL